jgi:hypothetical protein
MKIGDMTGRQILDAIARGLEESGRPFEREEEMRAAEARAAMVELAEDAAPYDRAS